MNEKQRLQKILDNNLDAANNGSGAAMMQCVAAQADLDRIAQAEANELEAYIANTPLPTPLILVD
jgi:hypothetical protein|tara:strand:- start:1511 stop:1705 length:195 start_codon:yes stop_codon:yes gene_type:complete